LTAQFSRSPCGDAFRVLYAVQIGAELWVIHAFEKKSKTGSRPRTRAAQTIEGGAKMTDDDMELIHGSGNVFRDLGLPNPEVEQLKAILAAKIIGILDEQKLTVRRAHELTGFAAADFSRVRQAKLSRFTVDRLMSMLDKLDQDVEVTVSVQPRRQTPAAPQEKRRDARRGGESANLI
jgi:predicted XRE-type DNA-binding protein